MCTINENHIIYGSWDMEQDSFFLILGHFLPFYPENEILKKWKKTPGDIIISCKCMINDNHMIYNSRDMKWRERFFSYFELFFALLPH